MYNIDFEISKQNLGDNNSLYLFTFIYVAYLVNVFCVFRKRRKVKKIKLCIAIKIFAFQKYTSIYI